MLQSQSYPLLPLPSLPPYATTKSFPLCYPLPVSTPLCHNQIIPPLLSTSGLYLLVFRILLHYKCLPSQQLSPPSGPSRGFLLPFLCFPLSSSFPQPSLRILAAILSVPLRPALPLSRSCLAPAESCNLLSPHHRLSCFARLLLLFFHLASPPLSSSPATPLTSCLRHFPVSSHPTPAAPCYLSLSASPRHYPVCRSAGSFILDPPGALQGSPAQLCHRPSPLHPCGWGLRAQKL